jgi:hypothetical protein
MRSHRGSLVRTTRTSGDFQFVRIVLTDRGTIDLPILDSPRAQQTRPALREWSEDKFARNARAGGVR